MDEKFASKCLPPAICSNSCKLFLGQAIDISISSFAIFVDICGFALNLITSFVSVSLFLVVCQPWPDQWDDGLPGQQIAQPFYCHNTLPTTAEMFLQQGFLTIYESLVFLREVCNKQLWMLCSARKRCYCIVLWINIIMCKSVKGFRKGLYYVTCSTMFYLTNNVAYIE